MASSRVGLIAEPLVHEQGTGVPSGYPVDSAGLPGLGLVTDAVIVSSAEVFAGKLLPLALRLVLFEVLASRLDKTTAARLVLHSQ